MDRYTEENKSGLDARIVRDMSEGILTVGMDGRILSVNRVAERILAKTEKDLIGNRFADCFSESVEDDAFNRTILNAINGVMTLTENIVPYYTATGVKLLNAMTSYLYDGTEKAGVIVVLNDVTLFARFLSGDVLKSLYGSPEGFALGGTKQTVSVLISDLRGFTSVSEQMEPGALVRMLNHYLEEMTLRIEEFHGTVIEIVGDGIMAIFGAPRPSETHAADAVAAALSMQIALKDVNRWNRERGYPELMMGIGVNSGDSVVGVFGSMQRAKYSALGPVVNLAGRIESYTFPGEVLISEYTERAVSAGLTTQKRTVVHPKGMNGAVSIMQVTGIGAPYAIRCVPETNEMKALSVPLGILFSRVTDKRVVSELLTGTVTAISPSGCTILTGSALKTMEELRIDLGSGVYAKVVSEEADGAKRVVFTSNADHFTAWAEGAQLRSAGLRG